MKKRWILLLLLGLALAGCREYQLQHTLYLEHDGRTSWQIRVQEHQRDEADQKDGETEWEHLQELLAGDHLFEELLMDAGAMDTGTILIRDRVPFEYVVKAEFASIDPIFEILFDDWPALTWETEWGERQRILRIWTDPESRKYAHLEDFPLVEVIVVDGYLRTGRLATDEPTTRMKLDQPGDWQELNIHWSFEP